MSSELEKFVEQLETVFKDNLKSVVLYGSKASGEDTKKNSDHNILVILGEVRFEDMKASSKAVAGWTKQGNPPPLLFTQAMLKESMDVFPIEFQDIKDNNRILYGQDLVSGLEIEDVNLRHEVEFELKGKLLKLRQGYMMYAEKDSKIRDLLVDSISSFLVLFKHTAKLLGRTPPKKKIDALDALSEKTGLKKQVFLDVFNMKHGDKNALNLNMEKVMMEYMIEIEKIVKIVNDL